MQPFLDSVTTLFETHLGVPVEVLRPKPSTGSTSTYNYCGVVTLTGDIEGRIVLGVASDVARAVVRAYIDHDDVTDEMIADGVGEITLVIVGRAISVIDGCTIAISPPSVVFGSEFQLTDRSIGSAIVMPCMTGLGTIQLELSLST